MTIKDPEQANLRDSHDSSGANQLEINFSKCRNETSSQPCASEEEIDSKIRGYTIMLKTLTNFVEYDDVDPGVGPIKRIATTLELMPTEKLELGGFQENIFSFIEHQVSLEDSLWQIMTEPVEFSLLNIDKTSRQIHLDFH